MADKENTKESRYEQMLEPKSKAPMLNDDLVYRGPMEMDKNGIPRVKHNPNAIKEWQELERKPSKAGIQLLKKGGSVKSSKASSRADGCAQRGKTKGRFV